MELCQRLASFLAIWDAARNGRPVPPAKSLIDPVELGNAGLLPFVWLVEMDAHSRFFYRLAGEEIICNFTSSIRRRMLGDVFDPETAELVRSCYLQVVEAEQIEFSAGPVLRDGHSSYYARRLLVPLRDDLGRTIYVMGVVDKQEYDRFRRHHSNPRYVIDQRVVTPVSWLGGPSQGPVQEATQRAGTPELAL